jgi:hypothetical protein
MPDLATVSFTIDENGATLVVSGPKVTVGPLSKSPSIGARLDKGKYVFVAGFDTAVIAPGRLPHQISAALDALFSGKAAKKSQPIPMPGIDDLRDPFGGYISYREYNNRRVSRLMTAKHAKWWPMLSQPAYESYLKLCKLITTRQVPGLNIGMLKF